MNSNIGNRDITNGKRCPNCGSSQYRDTIASEYCPACKMECNYWGSGPNKVYNQMCEDKWAEERLAQEQEDRYEDDW